MKYTNNHNLPDALVSVLTPERRVPVRGRYGVTALCDAPLPRILRMLYSDQIEVDASEGMYAMLGQAVHKYIDDNAKEGSSTEHKMEIPFGDEATIVGITDHYVDDTIIDWKVSGVFTYILGLNEPGNAKKEWIDQLNVYAWLHSQEGREVKALANYIILRDWVKSKSYEDNYPPIPFVRVNIPLRDMNHTEAFIEERVRRHAFAEHCALDLEQVDLVPCCLPSERWEKAGKWKVIHPDLKKSMRNLDTEKDALAWLLAKTEEELKKGKKGRNMKKAEVTLFPGENTRCLHYCDVSGVCPYYDELNGMDS